MFSLGFPPQRHFRRAIIFVFFVLGFAACNSSLAAPPSGSEALEDALRCDLQDYLSTRSSIEHISTLSLTVSFRGNSEDINMAVGTTKYNGGEPVTPENVFQTGSNTKSFTSVLLLQLEAAGVLSLDDTLGKWLPQYPAWKDVTIRRLLNMTSGIPTYDATPAWAAELVSDPYAKTTPEQLVGYVYPAIKTPAAWEYSNTGYILAQMIIDKASWWHSYEADLDQLIAVTDLHNTFYEPYFYSAAVTRRLVSGYYVNDDPGLEKLYGTDTSGYSLGWAQAAGGMISTPRDLTKWVRALFEGDVLQPTQKKELESLVEISSGESIPQTSEKHPQGFGLGVFQITDPALGLFWAYEGSTIGYRAGYAYFPDSGVIICVFTNSQTTHQENQLTPVLFPKLYATLKAFGKI